MRVSWHIREHVKNDNKHVRRSWKANSPTRATVSGRKGLDGIVVWQVGLRGNIDGAGRDDKKNDENRKERRHDDDADSIRRFDSYECRMPNANDASFLVPVTVQRGADFKISLGLPVLSN